MKCGFAKVDVTPSLGTPLCGQLTALPATGIESPLYTSAMYLDDGVRKLAFVSCDILFVTNEMASEIALEADVDDVIICATHTHSGPATVEIFGGNADNTYLKKLKAGIMESIVLASGNMQDAILKYSNGKLPGLAFNRRFIMKNGTIETHPLKNDPDIVKAEGPDSEDINVIWAETVNGKITGGIVTFGCHATVLERNNTLISSDFPGKVKKYLETEIGGTFLFMQGACGNICQVNPRNTSCRETGIDWAKKMGDAIGEEVKDIIISNNYLLNGNINIFSKTINLPRRIIPLELLEWANHHDNSGAAPPCLSDYGSESYGQLPPGKVSLAELFETSFWQDFYADEIKTLHRSYLKQSYLPFTIKVIIIGELAIVTLPCELFIEWQNKIIENSPFSHTIVTELANGWNGYVPTREAFSRKGGYETREVTSSMLAPEAGEIIYDAVLKILKQAKK